MSDLKYF